MMKGMRYSIILAALLIGGVVCLVNFILLDRLRRQPGQNISGPTFFVITLFTLLETVLIAIYIFGSF